jgi:D-tagatose-1,6-bisphosphate aldolase subunit GatZ/KbaZ
VLEAHSTDYQHPAAFKRLAELGFAFQKVGPALTFAYRQAIYALDAAVALAGWGESRLPAAMEALMLAEPGSWQGHYHGDDLQLQRHVGLADRIRYYWPRPAAQAAVAQLMARLEGRRLPDPLLWQVFAPEVLHRAEAIAGPRALALVHAQIEAALAPYFFDPSPRPGKEAR